VCKFYLLGICPYALFSNTKSDLGEHPHGEEDVDDLKEMYEVCCMMLTFYRSIPLYIMLPQ
jgi:LUC7 N_terminus